MPSRIKNSTQPAKHEGTLQLSISVRKAFSGVLKYFELERERKQDLIYDLNRLYKAITLEHDGVKLGEHDFKEYVIFSFEGAQIAILECPIIGNAMYVLEGNWRYLLRLSKAVLAERHDDVRIVHDRELLPELHQRIQTRRLQSRL